jgi:ABC-type multidrug transport system, ATPase and permease components
MKVYKATIILAVLVKFLGTFSEFLIPYVLEHMLDDVVPLQKISSILLWGAVMIGIAFCVRGLNIKANRMAVGVARKCIYDMRRDIFSKTLDLSGNQVDKYGLPSLISRITSDSYNVQNFIRAIQTLGIRAPILLLGGITATLVMDAGLAVILLILVPILLAAVVLVSQRGIPLFDRVQRALDDVVRIMRENITGIRVIKALSKEEHQTRRYREANENMAHLDIKASVVMSLPGPLIMLFLNIGLTIVVVLGAYRVNAGVTKPGVILAFLTYFNMILMGVGGLNRIFMMISKANASAKRIGLVLDEGEPFETVYSEKTESSAYIAFDRVAFAYKKDEQSTQDAEIRDMSFSVPKGGSLGIIGATGSGKNHHRQPAHALLRCRRRHRHRGRAGCAHLCPQGAAQKIRRCFPERCCVCRYSARKCPIRTRPE